MILSNSLAHPCESSCFIVCFLQCMLVETTYRVRKRNHIYGYLSSTEIMKELKNRSLNMMCKVKVGENWVKMSEFLSLQDNSFKNTDPNPDSTNQSVKESATISRLKDKRPQALRKNRRKILIPIIKQHTQLFLKRKGIEFGPYYFNEIKSYLKYGFVIRSDLVWIIGISDWVPLEMIPEMSDFLASSSVLPPPKPPPVVQL